jgi:hypothetical protein
MIAIHIGAFSELALCTVFISDLTIGANFLIVLMAVEHNFTNLNHLG